MTAAISPLLLAHSAGAAVALQQTPAEQPGGAATPAPVPAPAEAKPNTATILAVQGQVQVRKAPEGEWAKAVAGDTISQGGAVRTGLRSALQVRVGAGQVMTIDRMSVVEFSELVNMANTDRTRLGVDYGRVVFQVQSTEFANDLQIQAADATLAVKGTEGGIDANPETGTESFGTETNDGTFSVTYPDGTESDVSGDDSTDTENKDPADKQSSDTDQDTGDSGSREGDESDVVDRSTGGSDTTQSDSGTEDAEPDAPIVGEDEDGDGLPDIDTGGSGGGDGEPPPPPPPPAPGAFSILSPMIGDMNVMSSATFTWGSASDAANYTLIISTNPDLSNPMFTFTGLTSTSHLVQGLQQGVMYYWRVIAFNETGSSQTSPANFNTLLPLPGDFALLTPTAGMLDVATTATFTWAASSNATTYTLIISTSPDFSTPFITLTGLTGTSANVPGLQPGVMYYWRIIAMNSAGDTQSGSATFTTVAPPPPPPPPPPPQTQPNDFLISDAGAGTSFQNSDLILHPLAQGSSDQELGSLPSAANQSYYGGGYGGIFGHDDGLAAILMPDGSRVVYFVRGGEYIDGSTHAYNDLYRATISPSGVLGPWTFVTKYYPEDGNTQEGLLNLYSPMLAGLAFFGSNENTDLFGILRGPDIYYNAYNSDMLVNVRRNPNSLDQVMSFTIPLEGALASSHQRGSLFLVANVPSYGDRPAPGQRGIYFGTTGASILEFDPRNNYLKGAWTQFDPFGDVRGGGDPGLFQPGEGTVFDPSASEQTARDLFMYEMDVKGAAWVGDRLHLSMTFDLDEGRPDGRSYPNNPFTVRFNPNPSSGGEYVDRITESSIGVQTALGETVLGSPAAATTLSTSGASFDDYTINPYFAQLAFGLQPIQSGFLVALYQYHFLETSWDYFDCLFDTADDDLFENIPAALLTFVNVEDGIGHVTAALRDPIRPMIPFIDHHPCSGATGEGIPSSFDFFIGSNTNISDLRGEPTSELRLQPLNEVYWMDGDDEYITDLPSYYGGRAGGSRQTRGGSGGAYGGVFREDGLTAIGAIHEGDLRSGNYFQLDTFYVYGGYEEQSDSGEFYTFNELYFESFADYGTNQTARGDDWSLIEKYIGSAIPGDYEYGEPVLAGLATVGTIRADSMNPSSIGLFGVLNNDFDRYYPFFDNGSSQIVDVQTDFNIATPNNLVTLMDFQVPLEGAIAGATERGSLFVVANIAETFTFDTARNTRGETPPFYRAIIEFDPRANYIANAWGGQDLEDDTGTIIDDDLSGAILTSLTDYQSPVRGAAFTGGKLVLTTIPAFDGGGAAREGAPVPQLVYFDPEADGDEDEPHVARIEAAGDFLSALGEANNIVASVPPPPALLQDTHTDPMNLANVNEYFSKVAYSQQALNSGVVKRIFEKHFLETALDANQCRQSMLFTTNLPGELQANVGYQNGFGRTAYNLRAPLDQSHPCATENNPAPRNGARAARRASAR